ncbi:YqzG/YhdC family protein [Cytobacillus pseudoceanisediminis]|uniref:YqzG/YhdC family protein n=1 Tax=Cytobacillus pseudoceanisediminis TaxID=3051614 RepID=UPI0021611333|nr:YqzG/YhdC family protein [Cytobacillus firmus]
MKKYLSIFMLVCLLAGGGSLAGAVQKPDYEKYGRIAIAVVKEDYPGEEVVDYQYGGRKKVTETDVTDTFTFTVNEDGKPVTVLVMVTHNLKDNKAVSLTVERKPQ